MSGDLDILKATRRAFYETIRLKMEQFYTVMPQGENPALTGAFVEELVRGFIRDWISPCLLMHGTLYPHETDSPLDPLPAEQCNAKQIDGIVFDPRLGPPILREGSFLVAHPAFCHGVIEIKTSERNLKGFEERLSLLHRQYLLPHKSVATCSVMGVVIQDPDPDGHSYPDWESLHGQPLFAYNPGWSYPIFLLFKERGGQYEPYEPAIDALIRAVFSSFQDWPRRGYGGMGVSSPFDERKPRPG
jgi:hypothetical protein